MADSDWCRGILQKAADTLQRLTWIEESFRREMDEARTTWNDAAAREVFARHLELFRQQAALARDRLVAQSEQLQAVYARIAATEEPSREVLLLSEELARLRRQVDDDVQTTHDRADRSLDEMDEARRLADWATSTINSI